MTYFLVFSVSSRDLSRFIRNAATPIAPSPREFNMVNSVGRLAATVEAPYPVPILPTQIAAPVSSKA